MDNGQQDGHESSITSGRLLELVRDAGGFTIRRRNGRLREHGVCVGTRPYAELSFPLAYWDHVRVNAWLASVRSERRWRASHIDGWVDHQSGVVVLDIVRVVPCRLKRLAVLLGRFTKQDYAFDLSIQQVVVPR